MLRLRRLALGCALGSAAATAAIALVARLDFAYQAPALHVALETTAAITASAAAFLVLGRFRRTGFLDELILSAGLSLLALSNLCSPRFPRPSICIRAPLPSGARSSPARSQRF